MNKQTEIWQSGLENTAKNIVMLAMNLEVINITSLDVFLRKSWKKTIFELIQETDPSKLNFFTELSEFDLVYVCHDWPFSFNIFRKEIEGTFKKILT